VTLARTSLRRALRRGLRLSLNADETSDVRLRVTARIGRRTVDVGTAAARVTGRASLTVRARRAARRALSRARRATLTVAVEARDASGNVGTATTRRTLR
jgi:hypothetical protein